MTPETQGTTNEYTVTSDDMGKLLGGEGGVDLARVIRDGKLVGMRVVGVQSGTVASRLGAQNDDILESVNDVPVAAPGAMTQWSQSAMRDGKIVIRGTRAGQRFTTTLNLSR